MGVQSREDVSRTRSPQRLHIMKIFLGVGSGIARMNCFFTADDVLVPVVTCQIVSRACCHGLVLEILD